MGGEALGAESLGYVPDPSQVEPRLTNSFPLSLSLIFMSSSLASLCMSLPVLFTLPASAWRWGMSLKGYGSTLCHQVFSLLLLRVLARGR